MESSLPPETLKNGFSGSTVILLNSEPARAKPESRGRLAGKQIA
jgi:hypothetical protein